MEDETINSTPIMKWWLPRFQKKLKYECPPHSLEKFDERMNLLAKLLALYPFTNTVKLAREFAMKAKIIKQIAQFYGVRKTKETRRDINKNNGNNPRSRRAYRIIQECRRKEQPI